MHCNPRRVTRGAAALCAFVTLLLPLPAGAGPIGDSVLEAPKVHVDWTKVTVANRAALWMRLSRVCTACGKRKLREDWYRSEHAPRCLLCDRRIEKEAEREAAKKEAERIRRERRKVEAAARKAAEAEDEDERDSL